MKLLVCDLDGTLARSVAVDEECFIKAFADVFDIRDLNTTWMEYEHVTARFVRGRRTSCLVEDADPADGRGYARSRPGARRQAPRRTAKSRGGGGDRLSARHLPAELSQQKNAVRRCET